LTDNDGQNFLAGIVLLTEYKMLPLALTYTLQGYLNFFSTMPAKKFWPSLSVNSKKKCNPYFIVIMITVLIMNVIFWVVNFKTQNYFVISTTQNVYTSGYLCTIALILFIHVGFLEYLSFKQFKLIVKMTRIESGVTIPKGLFTLYLNVKKVTAKIFWSP
jgi:preprotein translocase subunit SecE